MGIELPEPARGRGPLRLPLLAATRPLRDGLIAALRRRGVAASALYPGTLADIRPLRPYLVGPDRVFSGARELADRLLTLPSYPGLTDGQIDWIARSLRQSATEAQ
jgi:dTDP-4-amino-4,6-dideoxygalactose transaminase